MQSRSWEATQRHADGEIKEEEAEIVQQQLTEDMQRRQKAWAARNLGGSESSDEEEELTFGVCHSFALNWCFSISNKLKFVAEEYVEVAQLAAVEEGGEDCEDELDREMLRSLFDEVDVDCSGTVTLSELAAHRHQTEEKLRNKQREAFQQV
jgi:hypothetical protein